MNTPPVIPAAALKQHVAVYGKTGSGKTSTAKLCIEQVVAEGARVCVLDPIKSDWFGLISSADGRRLAIRDVEAARDRETRRAKARAGSSGTQP